MIRKVEVVPHNPDWHRLFETESKQITIALGENAIAIHHIGSTSIETIYAKPIIDILVGVSSIAKVDEQNSSMQLLGYQCMGEFGIKERRFFLKDNPAGVRTHHIHTFEADSLQVRRHLAFRDYLNVQIEDALTYSALKRSLAEKYPNDIKGYMDGKHDFIQEIDRKAAEWSRLKNVRFSNRKVFADFLNRLASGESNFEEWQNLVVNHYHDRNVEQIRRKLVRLSIKSLDLHIYPEKYNHQLMAWRHELIKQN